MTPQIGIAMVKDVHDYYDRLAKGDKSDPVCQSFSSVTVDVEEADPMGTGSFRVSFSLDERGEETHDIGIIELAFWPGEWEAFKAFVEAKIKTIHADSENSHA